METSAAGVDLSSLAPPLRALIDGQQVALEALRAENAALNDTLNSALAYLNSKSFQSGTFF